MFFCSNKTNTQLFCWFNLSPNGKILDRSKAIAEDKINVDEMITSLSDTAENFVGKGENAGFTSIFSFSHNVFKSPLFQGR